MDTMQRAQRTVRYRVTLPIYSLELGGGAGAVETQLASAAGVKYVYVNAPMEMAYIEYDPHLTDPRALESFLRAAGFGPPGA